MTQLKKMEEQNNNKKNKEKENRAAVEKWRSGAKQVDPLFLEIGMLIVSKWNWKFVS